MAGGTSTAREEAERLVATVLAMASQGGGTGLGDMLQGAVGSLLGNTHSSGTRDRHGSGAWSTGSAECCACPVCRAIAAVRDPDPETAARLAAGAGDFASGVASLMRALSSVTTSAGPTSADAASSGARPSGGTSPGAASSTAAESARRPRREPSPDQAWSVATRAGAPEQTEPHVDETADPWGAAIRDEATAARTRAEEAAAARARAEEARRRVAEATELARKADAARASQASSGAERPGAESVTRPTDVWAAATANHAKRDAPDESLVAGTGDVDHDVAARATRDDDGVEEN
jgi:hypothetical protein